MMYVVVDTSSADFNCHWNQLLANDPLQNPFYSLPRRQVEFTDCSFLVLAGEEPVFGCGMTLHTDAVGRRCLGYFGIEASTLVNQRSMSQPSNNFCPEAIRLLQAHFARLIEELEPDALDYFDPVACGLMSPVTQVLLERGGAPTVYQARSINLLESEERLWRLMSEPCRRLVDWGRDHCQATFTAGLDVDTLETRIPRLFADGRGNARRVTLAHWQTCRELVRQGNGFIVQAELEGQAIASALFVHNDTTCHYVIDDTLLDTPPPPVLHYMIWQAVVRSKQLGCTRFDLGWPSKPAKSRPTFTIDPAEFGGTPQTRMKVTLLQ